MKKAELIKLLEPIDDDADVCIVNDEQELCYDILEVRTCEDNASEYKNKYADIVIDI